jgi:PAS domain S-box-containing protein
MPKRTASPMSTTADPGHGHAVVIANGLRRELLLHQQELQDQNQELRRTQLQLAAALDRYRDLFDRAPVGYFNLDAEGRVLEANQTAAAMIGQPRADLQGVRLSSFMLMADADRWHLHRVWAAQQPVAQAIELPLRRPGGHVVHAQLDCLGVVAPGGGLNLRVTLTDLTLQRQAEAAHRAARRVIAAQEAERLRMARQLHDDLGQRLSLTKMELARLLAATPGPSGWDGLLAALDGAVAIVRRVATELGPLMLADLGLAAAVDAYARDMAGRAGWQLSLGLPSDDLQLDEQDAVTLYRVFQQALALLATVDGLRVVTVDLVNDAGVVTLGLQGRPVGWRRGSLPAPERQRWRALQDSARLLGCDVSVDHAAGAGLRCHLRLSAAAAPAPAGAQ